MNTDFSDFIRFCPIFRLFPKFRLLDSTSLIQMPMHLIGATYADCWCTDVDALMWMYLCWYTDDDGGGCGRGLWSVLSVKLIRTSSRTFPAHSDLVYSLIPIIFPPHCEKLILAKVFWLITGSDFYSPLSPHSPESSIRTRTDLLSRAHGNKK